jgi:patatin-like phospholipase/acyl hydrolase
MSFYGGGIRGLLSATLLGRLAAKYPQIPTNTTLLAGISTGSLIVSALSSRQVVTQIPQFSNTDTQIADVVVASGFMPGMLPSYLGTVDGAFVHHDPTLAAIALALKGFNPGGRASQGRRAPPTLSQVLLDVGRHRSQTSMAISKKSMVAGLRW